MITHEDYDDINSEPVVHPYRLPEKITSVMVTHDGGRLGISINGEEVFYQAEGTRDCSVELNSD